jgi:hypothetical protein
LATCCSPFSAGNRSYGVNNYWDTIAYSATKRANPSTKEARVTGGEEKLIKGDIDYTTTHRTEFIKIFIRVYLAVSIRVLSNSWNTLIYSDPIPNPKSM